MPLNCPAIQLKGFGSLEFIRPFSTGAVVVVVVEVVVVVVVVVVLVVVEVVVVVVVFIVVDFLRLEKYFLNVKGLLLWLLIFGLPKNFLKESIEKKAGILYVNTGELVGSFLEVNVVVEVVELAVVVVAAVLVLEFKPFLTRFEFFFPVIASNIVSSELVDRFGGSL